MLSILSVILVVVFIMLGGFHLYWFVGGTWAAEKVIPSLGTESQKPTIPKFATFFVGVVLVLFGLMYLLKTVQFEVVLPFVLVKYGYWIIPLLFIIRAIGEFKYVGFFKKINYTEFAIADSKLLSSLCLVIGIVGILIKTLDQ